MLLKKVRKLISVEIVGIIEVDCYQYTRAEIFRI